MAHALAAMPDEDKVAALPRQQLVSITPVRAPNIGIVNAFNDMLSAHAPLQQYPDLIKAEGRGRGAVVDMLVEAGGKGRMVVQLAP